MKVEDLTIKKFADGLRKKEFSAEEVTRGYLGRIEKNDDEIGAYLHVMNEAALAQAKSVDARIAKGEAVGALAGVPLAIKDNMLITGVPATAGSKMLEHHVGVYDATVIKKLKDEGAVFLGKTNMDEFAMGSSTENSAYKKTKNPRDLTRVPGGSSGGSAAAVAGDMALGAFGSDTGGSIRQPAGFCGVVGLKPTYGAVSRYGLIAMASSLDQIGPFAKTVEDAALLFRGIAGYDKFDATSVNLPYDDEVTHVHENEIKNMTVGLPKEYFIEGLEPEVKFAMDKVIATIKGLGLKIREISLPHTAHALSCYYIIMPAEVSSNLARFDGIRYAKVAGVERGVHNLAELYKKNRHTGFGAEVKRRIMLGTFVLSSGYYDAYYSQAQKVRAMIKNDFDEAFRDVDMILTPVSPTRPFKFGEKVDDPLAMYLSDIFTIPANLAGVPAISIPVRSAKSASSPRESASLPIGFQLIGKHFREEDILSLGQMYEAA
ncbi:MAG: Asp-tRNA(Asn)/Glu-tRNA(Gln) amidotransferase subunit GatA [bacterium]|nr:Asp-tRNA(Asn)/Glu-tRNA(Gln) amidotransferase subunit GatA [bacterium]